MHAGWSINSFQESFIKPIHVLWNRKLPVIHFGQECDDFDLGASLKLGWVQKKQKVSTVWTLCQISLLWNALPHFIIWNSLLMQLDTVMQSGLKEEWRRDQNMCLLSSAELNFSSAAILQWHAAAFLGSWESDSKWWTPKCCYRSF